MSRKSRKQTLEEWEQLLEIVKENADRLPGTQAHTEKLLKVYLRARLAKELCDALAETHADAVHKLVVALAQGGASAACLRASIRERLGITACEIEMRLRRKPPVEL